jgi:hypothetical protein
MVDTLNVLTFLWLAAWAGFALWNMAKGRHYSINVLIVLHFLYSGVAPLLDVVLGQPDYRLFPGFSTASRDLLASVVTDLYVCICPVLWWWVGRFPVPGGGKPKDLAEFLYCTPLRVLAWCVFLIPPLLVLTSPDPSNYATYANILTEEFQTNDDVIFWDQFVQMWALGCVLAAALLLLAPGAGFRTLALLALPMAVNGYLEGKRWFVAVNLLLVMYVLWRWGALRGWRLLVGGTVAIAAMGGFSTWYQYEYRGEKMKNEEDVYEYSRLDYSRDHSVKLTVYAELNPEEGKILEYRGQSIVFQLLFFVPRKLWPGKPYPYGVYPTARALEQEPDYFGWGLTTSFLEESIANFSWLGLLVGPLTLAWACRVGDSCGNALIQLFTIMLTCLLLSVESQSFLIAIVAWIFFVCWVRWIKPGLFDQHLVNPAVALARASRLKPLPGATVTARPSR